MSIVTDDCAGGEMASIFIDVDSAGNEKSASQPAGPSDAERGGLAGGDGPPPGMAPAEFPDGGRTAWLTVLGGSACLFVSFGWVNCIGIFQAYYQQNQLKQYSPSEIAWIPSLQVFFMIFSGVFVGKYMDDYGPRPLLALGTLLHVFGLMMVSISKQYYQILLSQAVCSAIGSSMVFYPAIACVSTWFLKKRGAAMGLVAMGSSFGGVILPIILIQLIPKIGFGWAMRICAFLILALLVVANLTVQSRLKPSRRPFKLAALVKPLREPAFALLTAAIFFFYWGMFIPIAFIVVEARLKGMSPRLADYLVPILNAGSIIGRTVPNALADKVGHYRMMIVMSTFTTVLILALWMPTTPEAGSIAFAVLFGIASGAGIGLTPVLCAHISPIHDIGLRTGAAFMFSSVAALTGSPIGGQLLTEGDGSLKYAKAFSGTSCGVGSLLFAASWMAWRRQMVKNAKDVLD